jgi:hypothetical protein
MDGLVDGEMDFEDGDSDASESDITSRRSGFMRNICKVAIGPDSGSCAQSRFLEHPESRVIFRKFRKSDMISDPQLLAKI